jgi:hypothetical protein
MSYKHNEKNRDNIDKPRYKVSNWPEYHNVLRKRGDFTVYFTEEAITEWHLATTGSRGCPQKYSALAIKVSLMIRQVFRLPLRQTQGFMNSLSTALGIDITLPDFSSLSKRSVALSRYKLTKDLAPGSIVIVDSTGLKVYGKDEWHQEKHNVA